MKLVAKRGIFEGPGSGEENTFEQVKLALSKGFDVEVDVWLVDGKFFLGHDGPKVEVDKTFFNDTRIWSHCKTKDTYYRLVRSPQTLPFLHDDEDFALLKGGKLKWQHGRLGKFIYGRWEGRWNKVGYYRDNFKLTNVFIDVDGVMCKTKSYNANHECISKSFCDLDFTAIKRMKASNLNVVIVSGDSWNEGMADARGLPFIHTNTLGEHSKLNTLKRMNFNLEESAYIGDDYYDLPLLAACGFAYCPSDALLDVKLECHVLKRRAGEGVLCEMYDTLLIDKVALNEG